VPGVQAVQTAGEVGVPLAICSEPAAQVPWLWQLGWLLLLEYCPLGQGLQTRSTVVDGGLATKVPGRQVVQSVQVAALLTVLKVPLAQGAQVRSVVAVPSFPT
jgi:hypothetical protein